MHGYKQNISTEFKTFTKKLQELISQVFLFHRTHADFNNTVRPWEVLAIETVLVI